MLDNELSLRVTRRCIYLRVSPEDFPKQGENGLSGDEVRDPRAWCL